jgi:hypothetical protein
VIYITLQSLIAFFKQWDDIWKNLKMMMYKFSIPTLALTLLVIFSCNSQELPTRNAEEPTQVIDKLLPSAVKAQQEPHRYGGWYCPDNFGFVPVDIQNLNEIPAISNRLPTEEELKQHKSLIEVDTEKYPSAKALPMELPRIAKISTGPSGMEDLVIIIQAIVVQNDTVVGYRFANGGNGSARIREVTFLAEDEVAQFGSQPYFFAKTAIKATEAESWKSLVQSEYFQALGKKFDKKDFFSSAWNPNREAHLRLNTKTEKAVGFVGNVFGNTYLQIDYDRQGSRYSEKLLLMQNEAGDTTQVFFAAGPFPKDFEKENAKWQGWFDKVTQAASEQ